MAIYNKMVKEDNQRILNQRAKDEELHIKNLRKNKTLEERVERIERILFRKRFQRRR